MTREATPLLSHRLTSTRLLAGSLAALAFAGLVFALWPWLDIRAAALFYAGDGRFIGQTAAGEAVRRLFSLTPLVVLGVMAALYLARKAGLKRLWAPNGAGLLMMALSLALGPGLLVNTLLKDHSHRPRPYALREFGGSATFRPWFLFDGSCVKNCSLASGEGASAFWTTAPALLAPIPVRTAALAAALIFATATSLLRMAFGGHFLSDTILAALLTWLVIVLCWRAVAALTRQQPAGLDPQRSPAEAPG